MSEGAPQGYLGAGGVAEPVDAGHHAHGLGGRGVRGHGPLYRLLHQLPPEVGLLRPGAGHI